jgi:sugar O-acyltransferase (sialic acid O-acetyltransferase NeuD family)
MNNQFVIIGAGGHAKVIIEIIEEMKGVILNISDTNSAVQELLGYSVTEKPVYTAPVIIAIGNNSVRKRIANEVSAEFGTAIHPGTHISSRCTVGEGTVVMAGVTINSHAGIGRHCIINTNACVDHDCRIGDFVHISPNAALGGGVTVGEGTHIGIGVAVIPGIQIGKWATVGAGSVVIRDVPDYATVVGNPAVVIKLIRE